MVAALDTGNVKVYTVNGAALGSASSLPDWLTRKRAANGKGKRAAREHVEGTIQLIQGFEFPEASIRIKTTRDGHHAIATGTYKPQIKVWDLDQLSQKFERHSDAENIDFIILSDDWTKSIHLQNDRTIELHTQSGFHYRTRIPRFGRSLAYHFPSCDAFCSAAGNEIYRLNLDQGRFLNPLILTDEGGGDIPGVNIVDINPAHQLLALGVEGNGTVQFWDLRSRSSVGVLRLPKSRLLPSSGLSNALPSVEAGVPQTGLSVTAIASRADGLSYAIGTSTGHTLLYDIRSARPFALKEQGYGASVKNLLWIEGGGRMAGDGMVLSADKKVIKIWDRHSPSTNFTSITPSSDLNHAHHVPGSGILMTANEGIQMATYYIPQLGPAPRWASFLEHITEEIEDQTVRTVYEDFKFVERSELKTLGLDRFIGTPIIKPYMHGYFLSLKLYDTARVIANPFAYAEHREKIVTDKMAKMAETRIRTKNTGVKVNKALAEKIVKEEERARKRDERRKARKADKETADDAMDVEGGIGAEDDLDKEKPSLLTDPRFSRLFEDPEFAVDETTREYALMNPSAVARKMNGKGTKTAVEDEDDESDKASSDGLGEDESEIENSGSDPDESDSSDPGDLNVFDIRNHPNQKNERLQEAYTRQRERNRTTNVKLVPLRAQTGSSKSQNAVDKNATFGQRRHAAGNMSVPETQPELSITRAPEGGMEMSWVPSSSAGHDQDDSFITENQKGKRKENEKRRGVEKFGAGLEKGGEDQSFEMTESSRKGRTQRRKGIRSGSKAAFKRMGV